MKELLQDIRESLKDRVTLDRQDKRELVNTIAKRLYVMAWTLTVPLEIASR